MPQKARKRSLRFPVQRASKCPVYRLPTQSLKLKPWEAKTRPYRGILGRVSVDGTVG